MSGRELKVLPDHEVYTDTVNIYLPAIMARFPDREDNLALYKLAAANAWAQIALGTLDPDIDPAACSATRFPVVPPGGPTWKLFRPLPRPTARTRPLHGHRILQDRIFPDEGAARADEAGGGDQAGALPGTAAALRIVRAIGLCGRPVAVLPGGKDQGGTGKRVTAALASLYGVQYESGPGESIRLLFEFYDAASALPGEYVPAPRRSSSPASGRRRWPSRLAALRQDRQKRLEAIITKIMTMPDLVLPPRADAAHGHAQPEIEAGPGVSADQRQAYRDGRGLRSLIEEKGGIPGGILVKGSEMGGESPITLADSSRNRTEQRAGRREPATG